MQYYLHRIAHLQHISYPLLEKGFLSIGFSDFSNEDFIKKVSERDWNYFEKTFKDLWGIIPRIRYSLWRFTAEMSKGDWVIVPGWGTYSIYEIEDDGAILTSEMIIDDNFTAWGSRKILRDNTGFLMLDGDKEYLDIGFLRKVKIIAKDISRYDYADSALTSRMKIRCTNANISDLEKNINNSLKLFKENKPIDLKSILYELTVDNWLKAILSELNDNKFEKLVQNYFLSIGAADAYISSKNESGKDGDVDIVAVFESIRTIINVQVKYHKGQTSDWAIKQIKDFAKSKEELSDGYSRQYWVISSSDSFSDEGIELAKESNVILIDGRQFVKMLMDAGIQRLI
jgi:predicted Mrr-cat superfamily restriction endonuclease